MSWNLNLSFENEELTATFNPPTEFYFIKEIISANDLSNPYLEDVVLDNYEDGDYIRVIVVDEDVVPRNDGTLTTGVSLYDTAEVKYAFVTVYDDKDKKTEDKRRSSERVTNEK